MKPSAEMMSYQNNIDTDEETCPIVSQDDDADTDVPLITIAPPKWPFSLL